MLNLLTQARARCLHATRGLVLLLAALAVLPGCSSFGSKLESPELSLVGIQMLSTDMFAQKFKMRVLVKNPNELEIPVRGIDYTIILMGDSFAEGVSKDQFLLPARGEAEFDMLVTANLAGTLLKIVERTRKAGGSPPTELSYRLRGEVKLDKSLLRTVPFDQKGSLRLR